MAVEAQSGRRTWRITVGWSAVALNLLVPCLWAFWGAVENFHEGWHHGHLGLNLLWTLAYLGPMLAALLLGLLGLRWPRPGGLAYLLLGGSFGGWFLFGAGFLLTLLMAGGCGLIGLLFWFGQPRPRRLAYHFAPGLGETARLTLLRKPASYTAVERDKDAAARVQKLLHGPEQRCVVGLAENTGLPDASATVVYGEAMLSMQTPQQKSRIVREAHRLLRPGGRYGIQELCLIPNDLDENAKLEIQTALSRVIHHGTRPLTLAEWQGLLESAVFSVQAEAQAPMHLLEPWRIIQDEGMFGAWRFAINLLCNREARRRVLAMRRVFSTYRDNLAAVMLIGRKKEDLPQ